MDIRRVLLVEDSDNDAILEERLLERAAEAVGQRFAVERAASFGSALRWLGERAYDAVLLDLGLPDGDGLGSVDTLVAHYPGVPIVVLTGLDDVHVALDAVAHGAQDFLVKGRISADALGRAINYAIVRAQLERRNQRMLAALEASEQRFRELFQMSLGLICEHEIDGTLRAVNPAAAAALGYTPPELVGKRLDDIVPERFRASVPQYLATIARDGRYDGLMTVATRDGRWRAWRLTNRLHVDPGRAPYVIGYAQDVTDELRSAEELREQSLTDPLTQARNRRWLDRIADGSAQRFGCVVVDLDHFKRINDTEGHQRGDEVLIAVAQFLREHAKRNDAVVRTGGDEFVVVLLDEAAEQAPALAERLRAAAPAAVPCGLSIGAAIGAESLGQTIRAADEDLYVRRRAARAAAARD